jgi:D,D-heptose 1,7-bisphosphate phosphatase
MSNKAIFLDRDGTLIEDPGYLNHPEQVKLLEGVAEALIELRNMGYMLIVTTNQSAVARGIVSEKVLGEIHNRLRQLLTERGAYLDQIYYCPYHPDGVIPKYRKESEWRKPNPGMLLAASEEMDIDLSQSWKIGDSSSDIEAGLRAGCKTILVTRLSRYTTTYGKPDEAKPDYKSVNMKEAVNIIKKYHRSSNEVKAHPEPAQKSKTKPAVEPEPEPAAEPEPETAAKPKSRSAAGPKSKPVPKPKAKPVVESEPEPAPELESQPVPEPETKPTTKTTKQKKQKQADILEQDDTAAGTAGTEQLLNNILVQLKGMQRANMFGEFSIMRLMAGVVQIIVLFCLLITIFLLMRPARQDNSVLIALGFAMVLQMMSLTFYIMQGRK